MLTRISWNKYGYITDYSFGFDLARGPDKCRCGIILLLLYILGLVIGIYNLFTVRECQGVLTSLVGTSDSKLPYSSGPAPGFLS